MILTGEAIKRCVMHGDIEISPFEEAQLNPNSYDLRLDLKSLLKHDDNPRPLDCAADPKDRFVRAVEWTDGSVLLEPRSFYLASTIEKTWTDSYVPMIEGRSSLARLGISIHQTAGFGDIGFSGVWTLEITVAKPIFVYDRMKLCQVYFLRPDGPIQSFYHGKYMNNDGVQTSKLYKDFE